MTVAPAISIIDDDASIRAGLNNLVRSLGYIVSTFSSAAAFLQSTQLHKTCCVIADVRMPAMSGVELQSHLRSQGYKVPFIFITAVPDEATRKQALDDGAICFLTKPFDEGTLIECLNTALDQHRGETKS
ncbi:response regulator [Bradyrhizobium sp. dw_411]|uniref:response regulator transcription factor n=1 Tax=Bradyrhizobium sp. dw_411 TaxID=2720082 RepID=UPI0023DF011D|nr:response regulator [Bradyrhizobium sp. dw_411]